ncbi:lipid droplet-associated protein [Amycolatopsis antarctica]|uniref:lipid droplet-associated protein n=1 Tax=Amycolatopsis antarctica TaxID=1854586 RepID=UPI0010548B29|nr:lipid droplet-associated protein [Amycolatopsis antarctica]
MKPIPFPLRVAAGLAVTTAERVRELPKQVAGFPVTVASQVLQASMRVQQQVTELAIRGDDVLSALRPAEETPGWATFDEEFVTDLSKGTSVRTVTDTAAPDPAASDTAALAKTAPARETRPADVPVPRAAVNGNRPATPPRTTGSAAGTPSRTPSPDSTEQDTTKQDTIAPGGVEGYDELSLPQLRAKLRHLSVEQLTELLSYERARADRPSFTGMLARRIGNVRKAAGEATTEATGDDAPDSGGQATGETGR